MATDPLKHGPWPRTRLGEERDLPQAAPPRQSTGPDLSAEEYAAIEAARFTRSATRVYGRLASLLVSSAYGERAERVPYVALVQQVSLGLNWGFPVASFPSARTFDELLQFAGGRLGLLFHYHESHEQFVDFMGRGVPLRLDAAHNQLPKRITWLGQRISEFTPKLTLPSAEVLSQLVIDATASARPAWLRYLGLSPGDVRHEHEWTARFEASRLTDLAEVSRRRLEAVSGTLFVILVLLPALRENRQMRGDLAKQFAEVLESGDAGEAAKTLGSYFQAYPTELGELQAPENFDELRVVREAFGLAMKTRLEASLCDRLASLENATPDAKRKFTIGLRDELDALDLRVQCPECHQAATLRFGRKGNMEEAFSFDHTQPPRSSHASSVNVPTELTLMLKPPDRRRGDIGRFPDEPKREQSRPAEPAYMHNLRELVARVAVGDTSPTDKGNLLRVLREAKKESPPDRAAFVNLVNRALDALGLRIKLSDGSLAKLRITPGATGKGFIQFKLFGYPGNSRGWGQDRPTGLAPLP